MSTSLHPSSSQLQTRQLSLENLLPDHYPTLFQIASSDAVRWTWEPSSQGGAYESFAQRLWDGVFCQYTIKVGTPSSKRVVGLVKCYGANFRHQTAQLSIFVDERSQRTGLGMRAFALFVDWLFSTYPFRKLYAEMLEFNFRKLESGAGKFFFVEGRLQNHEIHYGKEWDNYILAFERSKWEIEGRRSVERLRTR